LYLLILSSVSSSLNSFPNDKMSSFFTCPPVLTCFNQIRAH
jgi:hypothetical protein